MTANKKYISLSVIVILLIWEGVSLIAGENGRLPGPVETLKAVFLVLCDPSFIRTVCHTLVRAVAGFVLAAAIGGVLGIAAGLNNAVHSFLKPWLVAVRTTPVVVFILLAVVWFSPGTVPVLIGVIMMMPVIYLNIAEGIRNVDPDIVCMARFYGTGKVRMLKDVYFPAIRPFVSSGVSNAVGLGWRAIVAAEVLSHPQWGIGAAMHSAQIIKQADVLMAWAFVTVVFGAVFEKILDYGYSSGRNK